MAVSISPPISHLGTRIKRVRLRLGMSQNKLAHTIGYIGKNAGAYISRLEAGTAGRPRADNLVRIADALQVSIDWLLTGNL